MTCKFAMDWGTDLVFKHHTVTTVYMSCTQYHFPQSKVRTAIGHAYYGVICATYAAVLCIDRVSLPNRYPTGTLQVPYRYPSHTHARPGREGDC